MIFVMPLYPSKIFVTIFPLTFSNLPMDSRNIFHTAIFWTNYPLLHLYSCVFICIFLGKLIFGAIYLCLCIFDVSLHNRDKHVICQLGHWVNHRKSNKNMKFLISGKKTSKDEISCETVKESLSANLQKDS